jgi:hypothetical protein
LCLMLDLYLVLRLGRGLDQSGLCLGLDHGELTAWFDPRVCVLEFV